MTPAPLDTPPDWHAKIALRQHEWETLGPAAAIALWRERGEMSRAVLDIALADHAARKAGEAVQRG